MEQAVTLIANCDRYINTQLGRDKVMKYYLNLLRHADLFNTSQCLSFQYLLQEEKSIVS